MQLVTWNVRGFNKLYKHQEMIKFLEKNDVGFIVILNHIFTAERARNVITRAIQGWSWKHNYNTTGKGKIWILWDQNRLKLHVLKTILEFMHSLVTRK